MNRTGRLFSKGLGLLLLVALAAAATWLILQSRPRAPQAAQGSPLATPTPGQLQPSPSPTQAAAAPRPTATKSISVLNEYVFAAPQIVLTHTAPIGIAGWLPNNQEVLLTLRQPGSINETIETFNIITKQRRLYSTRPSMGIPPIWLNTSNRVAYTALTGRQYDLWIRGHAEEHAIQPVLLNVNPAFTGYGDRVIAVQPDQGRPVQLNGAGQLLGPIAVDLTTFGFIPGDPLTNYRMTLSPTAPKLALYDTKTLLIADVQTGDVQRLDLGEVHSERSGYGHRWAFAARWSPNGRYLALLTTVGTPVVPYTELTIVNADSGLSSQVPLEVRYVHDVAWAPDSRVVVSLGEVSTTEGKAALGLYLIAVSLPDGAIRRMLPEQTFGLGTTAQGLSWSSDGSAILLLCPQRVQTEPPQGENRLCSIEVSRSSQAH